MGVYEKPATPAEGATGTVIDHAASQALTATVTSFRDGLLKVVLDEPLVNRGVVLIPSGYCYWFRRDRLGLWHEVAPVVSSGRYQWTGSGREFAVN